MSVARSSPKLGQFSRGSSARSMNMSALLLDPLMSPSSVIYGATTTGFRGRDYASAVASIVGHELQSELLEEQSYVCHDAACL